MRLFALSIALSALMGTANAFTTTNPSFVRPQTALKSTADNRPQHHMDEHFTPDGHVTAENIPAYIQHIDGENFDETLEILEPVLTEECEGVIQDIFMADLMIKAKKFGKKIPDDYGPLRP